jgi:hypothetical protein
LSRGRTRSWDRCLTTEGQRDCGNQHVRLNRAHAGNESHRSEAIRFELLTRVDRAYLA